MPADQSHSHPTNVILIGFMGSGKSTTGRKVASELNFDFLDTDEIIEENAGMSIPEIFAKEGEEHFRNLESAVLDSLRNRSNLVIATGGGIILRPQNCELLKQLGFIAWLDAAEDVIFERISRNKNRPLVITDDPRETVARLLEERRPLYRQIAHLPVKTHNLNFDEITHGIVESAKVYFSETLG